MKSALKNLLEDHQNNRARYPMVYKYWSDYWLIIGLLAGDAVSLFVSLRIPTDPITHGVAIVITIIMLFLIGIILYAISWPAGIYAQVWLNDIRHLRGPKLKFQLTIVALKRITIGIAIIVMPILLWIAYLEST